MKKKIKDYHLIQTDHPYFAELGLSIMTTGSLAEWWNTKNSEGIYVNRKHLNKRQGIEDTFGNVTNSYGALFGFGTVGSTDFNTTEYFWYGWKPNPTVNLDGRYLRQNLSDKFGKNSPAEVKGDGGAFSYDSEIGTVKATDTESLLDTLPIIGGSLDTDLKFVATTASDKFVEEPDLSTGSMGVEISPLYDLIQLNRKQIAFEQFYPRRTWNKREPTTFGDADKKQTWANHELLSDIKASKGNIPVVRWSGEVTFYVNVNDGLIEECPITEWVPFRMYLFDENTLPTTNTSVALNSTTFVGPRRDVTGKAYSASSDGSWTEGVDDVAAELDVSYNPYTKKLESGTPQLMAKMVEDLPPMQNSPDVEKLQQLNLSEALSKLEEQDRFVLSSGVAMPIRLQNGNNLQWTPNYLNSEEVRCQTEDEDEKNKKETLTVYNMTTQRTFRKNEEVMLSRLDGKWVVSQLGLDPSGTADVTGGEAGKWGEMYYLYTNNEGFFRYSIPEDNGIRGLTPALVETFFHNYYYNQSSPTSPYRSDILDRELNYNIDYKESGGYNYATGGFNNKTGTISYIHPIHTFAQTTSFDYLDSKIMGIRGDGRQTDRCSIASTNPLVNSCGVSTVGDVADFVPGGRNGLHTGAFFGCIFPGGYTGTSEYFGDTRDWEVKSIFYGQNDPKFLNTASQILPDDAPFKVDDQEGFDKEVRNNCRNSFAGDANKNQGSLNDNRPVRSHFKPQGSIFFEETVNSVQTLRHLPADVALNASPFGKNGSPFKSVHSFYDLMPENPGDSDPREKAKLCKVSANWLFKNNFGGEGLYTANDSAFDFKPISQTIMFRPLKLENYVQFGAKKKFPPQDPDNPQSPQNLTRIAKQDRTGFETEAHRSQFDFYRPATHSFEDREFKTINSRLWDQQIGLRYSDDILVDRQFPYTDRNACSYWNHNEEEGLGGGGRVRAFGAMQWGGESYAKAGGQAFGIIATCTTVNAGTAIIFNTDNQYGMGPNFLIGKDSAGFSEYDYDHGWSKEDRGQFGNRFACGNCPDLSVRVYHEHPRAQTLYDPRCFAVHHFNPDMYYAHDKFMGANGSQTDIVGYDDKGAISNPRVARNGTKSDFSGSDSSGDDITFSYYSPVPSSTVDFKLPSRYVHFNDITYDGKGASLHANNGYYHSQPLVSGDIVYSNATRNHSDNLIKPPLMGDTHWQIQTSRVGKLLPYQYESREQGIPYKIDAYWHDNLITVADGLDSNTFDGTRFAINVDPSKIIYDSSKRETGFVVGDEIGILSKNVLLEVAGVDGNGSISTLKVKSLGVNVTSAAASGAVLTQGYKGPIKMTILNSENGKDLNLSFLTNMIYSNLAIDPKPKLMSVDGASEFTVSSLIDEPTESEGTYSSPDAPQAGSFVKEERESTIILDQNHLSPNGSYDVFYFFHNDITMTWMASNNIFHGAGGSNQHSEISFQVAEQYITSSITTT